MADKIITRPIYILKNLRPHYLVGWLHTPVKTKASTVEADRRTQAFRASRTPEKPKKSHLRLVAVDGKIIDPSFQ